MVKTELAIFMAREEFSGLSSWHKQLLERFALRFRGDMPIGRSLALGCMQFNHRYSFDRIPQDFINWLYYY